MNPLSTTKEERKCGLHLSTAILHGSFKEELTAYPCCISTFCVIRHRKYFTRIHCHTVICSNRKFGQLSFIHGELFKTTVFSIKLKMNKRYTILRSKPSRKCMIRASRVHLVLGIDRIVEPMSRAI